MENGTSKREPTSTNSTKSGDIQLFLSTKRYGLWKLVFSVMDCQHTKQSATPGGKCFVFLGQKSAQIIPSEKNLKSANASLLEYVSAYNGSHNEKGRTLEKIIVWGRVGEERRVGG